MAQLTEQQAAFAMYFVANGGNATQAAKEAGYSEKTARQIAGNLMQKEHVMLAIREEQTRALSGRLSSKALLVLENVMDNPDAPHGVKVDAAKAILDRGGLSVVRAGDDGAGMPLKKSLSEMTIQELEAFILKAEQRGASEVARIRKGATEEVEAEDRQS